MAVQQDVVYVLARAPPSYARLARLRPASGHGERKEAQGRFLFSATVELFEHYGFTRGRRVGKHAWIVSRAVEPG